MGQKPKQSFIAGPHARVSKLARGKRREFGMDFNRPEWLTMHGGYRVPYDPRDALLALERDENAEPAWNEL
jgi:hypothetical protein